MIFFQSDANFIVKIADENYLIIFVKNRSANG